jgi:hypothetical protein
MSSRTSQLAISLSLSGITLKSRYRAPGVDAFPTSSSGKKLLGPSVAGIWHYRRSRPFLACPGLGYESYRMVRSTDRGTDITIKFVCGQFANPKTKSRAPSPVDLATFNSPKTGPYV